MAVYSVTLRLKVRISDSVQDKIKAIEKGDYAVLEDEVLSSKLLIEAK